MLASVVQIDDLHGAWGMVLRQLPSSPTGTGLCARHWRRRATGRLGKQFRRVEESVGMPGDGAHHGTRLQLVDHFHAAGNPGQTRRGDYPRPLALHGIAWRTRHGNPTKIEVTSTHSKAPAIAEALTKVSGFLKRIKR